MKNLSGITKILKPFAPTVLILFIVVSCTVNKSTVQNQGNVFTLMDTKEAQKVKFESLYLDAIKADLVENNPIRAISKLQRCLDIEPKNSAAMFKLGEVYFKQGRLADAQKVMEKAVSINKHNKWYFLLLSDIYMSQKMYDKSIDVYKSLLEIEPENALFMTDLANLYLYKQDYSNAIKIYDQMEQEYGVLPEISIQKQKIYIAENKLEMAIEEIEKLVAVYPENIEYLKLLIDVSIAAGKDTEVPQLYEQLMALDSNDGNAQLAMADFYFNTNEKEKASDLLIKAFTNTDLGLQSKIEFLVFNYMSDLEKNKELILKLSNILVETHSENARVYALRGDILTGLKENEQALTDYTQALKKDQSQLVLWQKAITLNFELGHYENATSLCDSALEFFPNSASIYFYQGLANIQLKEYKDAVDAFSAGVGFVIDNPKLKFQFYSNLGEAYNSLKDYVNSDAYFEKALEINPEDALVLNNYAYYLSLRKEKLDRAKEMSEKSLEKGPNSAAYLDTYGWILFLNKEYKDAEKYIRKALDQRKWDADILEHYGDCLYYLDRVDEAVEYWEKAKRKGSISTTIDEKIENRKFYE